MPALAPAPVIRRPTIMRVFEFPTGQSAFHRIYQAFAKSQTCLRPLVSAQAAIRNGAKAMPRKYVEKMICDVEGLMSRSC